MISRKPSSVLTDLIKYGVVGGVGALIDVGVFFFGFHVLHISYIVSNIISSHFGIINNFFLNSYFTFSVNDSKIRRFSSYYCAALIGMVVSSVLLFLCVKELKLKPMVAKIITLAIVTFAQFIYNRSITFRRKG
jgi:putative flippase GtrA